MAMAEQDTKENLAQASTPWELIRRTEEKVRENEALRTCWIRASASRADRSRAMARSMQVSALSRGTAGSYTSSVP